MRSNILSPITVNVTWNTNLARPKDIYKYRFVYLFKYQAKIFIFGQNWTV